MALFKSVASPFLVERIVPAPDPNGKGLLVDLDGDLAGILNIATKANSTKRARELDMKQIRMVVGMNFAVAAETQGKVVGPAGLEPATRPL